LLLLTDMNRGLSFRHTKTPVWSLPSTKPITLNLSSPSKGRMDGMIK